MKNDEKHALLDKSPVDSLHLVILRGERQGPCPDVSHDLRDANLKENEEDRPPRSHLPYILLNEFVYILCAG